MANRRKRPDVTLPSRLSRPESPRKVTPPERKGLLQSPPASVQRLSPTSRMPRSLLDYKFQAEIGEVPSITSISLSQQEFSNAQDEIEIAIRRFDYEPRRGRIILRMPSPTHDTFVGLINKAIYAELTRVASHHAKARLFASQILMAGSSRIFPNDDNEDSESNDRDEALNKTRRQPDAQYHHPKAAFPGVVVEVSYSQDKKQLSKIAKQYIHSSDGNIKAIIYMDIDLRA